MTTRRKPFRLAIVRVTIRRLRSARTILAVLSTAAILVPARSASAAVVHRRADPPVGAATTGVWSGAWSGAWPDASAVADRARLAQSPPADPAPVIYDNVAYIAPPFTTTVERWDLAMDRGLPPLVSRDPIVQIAVGARGVFVLTADTQRIMRWPLEGGTAVPVAELAGQSQGQANRLALLSDHLLVLAWQTVFTLDADTGAIVDRRTDPTLNYGVAAIAPGARAYFTLTAADEADVQLTRVDVDADGMLGQPRFGATTGAIDRLTASADGEHVLDANGTLYDGRSLAAIGAVGRRPAAALWHANGIVTVDQQHLWQWSSTGQATGHAALDDAPFGLGGDGSNLWTFGRRTVDGQATADLVVRRVAPDAFQPFVAVPADPNAAPVPPDYVAAGRDGHVIVGSRARGGVFRWSAADRRWLDGFALPAGPADAPTAPWVMDFAYDAVLDRVFVLYADGGIDTLSLSGPAAGIARPFAFERREQEPTVGMVAAGSWLVLDRLSRFAADGSNAFAPDGRGSRMLDPTAYGPPSSSAWDAANKRLIRVTPFTPDGENRLDVVAWDAASGPSTATVVLEERGLDVRGPLFVAPDGRIVLTGSGLVLSGTDLATVDSLSSPVTAAAWTGGRLVTARSVFGHSEVVVWGADHRPTTTRVVGGDVAALVARGDAVLAVSRWNGGTVVTEWGVSSGLTERWAGTPPPPGNDAPDMPHRIGDVYPSAGVVTTIDTEGATRGAGEPPASCGGADQRPVWFEAGLNHGGGVVIDSAGSTFDTTLSLWRKDESGALVEVACAGTSAAAGAARIAPGEPVYGPHWIAVSGRSGAGGRVVLSIVEAARPEAKPLQVAEDPGGLWCVRPELPRLDRWDFAGGRWSTSIALPDRVSRIAAGTGGLWLASGRRVLWLPQGATTPATWYAMEHPIADLAATDVGVLVLDGNALWHLDAQRGALLGWRALSASNTNAAWSIEVVEHGPGRAWVDHDGVRAPWTLLVDGRIGHRAGDAFRAAADPFASDLEDDFMHWTPGAPTFVETGRTVVNLADGRDRYRLAPLPSFVGQPYDPYGGIHDAIVVDGAWVGAIGRALAAWDGAGTMTSWRALPSPAVHISRRGDTLLAVLDPARTSEGPIPSPTVIAVPLAQLGPFAEAVPDAPDGATWSPGLVAVSGDTLVLGARGLMALRRWSAGERRWLAALPLADTPIRLAAEGTRLWVWLADGSLLTGAAGDAALTKVAQLTRASCGLVALQERAFACEMTTERQVIRGGIFPEWDYPVQWSIRGADGALISRQDIPESLRPVPFQGVQPSSNWGWHPPSRRLIVVVSGLPRAVPVSPDGQLGALVTGATEISSAGYERLWVDGSGDEALTSGAARFRPSDLASLESVPAGMQFGAAMWRAGRLWTARHGSEWLPELATSSLEVRRGDGALEATGEIRGNVTHLVPTAEGMLAIGGAHRPGLTDDIGGGAFEDRFSAPLITYVDDAPGLPEAFRLPAAPVNDRPAGALALVANSAPLTVDTVDAGSDGDGQPPSCAPGAGGGVWFWVDASNDNIALDLAGTDHDTVLTAYAIVDGRQGAEVACVAGTAATPPATVLDGGQDRRYLIRLAHTGTGGTAQIRMIPAPPRNDHRVDAAVIAALPFTTTASLRNAVREPDREPGCPEMGLADAWWRFTAPGAMRLQASVTPPSGGPAALAVWRGADAAENAICRHAWSGPAVVVRLALAAGETVSFQVLGAAYGDPLVFTAESIPPAPPGDDLAGAVDVPALPYETVASPGLAATEPDEAPPSCSRLDGEVGSLWWRFRAERATAVRALVSGGRSPSVVSMWRGDTHPLTEVGCVSGTDAPDYRGPRVDLAAGEAVWIRLDGRLGEADRKTMRLLEPSGPANDRLGDAPAADLLPFEGTAAMAEAGVEPRERVCGWSSDSTRDAEAGDRGDHTAWWRFTAPATGRARFTVASANTQAYVRLAVWTGDAHPLKVLACTADETASGEVIVDVRAGVRYAVQIVTYRTMTDLDDAARVGIEMLPPLANDDLAAAAPVTPFPSAVRANTERATNEPRERAPSCSGTAGRSVWWRLASPPAAEVVQIDVVDANFDTVLSAWKGAHHPLDEAACSDDASPDDNRASVSVVLEPGEPVWVKLEGFANAGGVATVQFGGVGVEPRLWLPWAGVGGRARGGGG